MALSRITSNEQDLDTIFSLDNESLLALISNMKKKFGELSTERFLRNLVYTWIKTRLLSDNLSDREMAMMYSILNELYSINLIEANHQYPFHTDSSKIAFDPLHTKPAKIPLHIIPYDYSTSFINQKFPMSDISDRTKIYSNTKTNSSFKFYEHYTSKVNDSASSLSKRPPITDSDILAVQDLLQDWKTLEAIFKRFAAEFTTFTASYVQQRVKMFGDNVKLHHKLFTTFCKQWATKHGFVDFVKLRDGLTAKQFGEQLTSHYLFDDIAFRGTGHGAISHFMQWVAITYHYEDTKFMRRTPAELYAWLGQQEINGSKDNHWFYVFEFGVGKSTVSDMQQYLSSKKFRMKAPLLADMIEQRESKGKRRLGV